MIFIKNLYIITPFKGNNIKKLKRTVSAIKKLNFSSKIIHLIISYKTKSFKLYEIKNMVYLPNYEIITISIKESGIYNAINKGLDLIGDNSFYIVLGSGDLIKSINNKEIRIKQEEITFLNYSLSSKKKVKLLRDIYSGMPYCHNAIIFKNSKLRYSNNYRISSDYEYFLNYLINCKFKLEELNINIKSEFKIIFESEDGISSKSRFRKNIENLLICYKFFGIKGIIRNILNNFIKVLFSSK